MKGCQLAVFTARIADRRRLHAGLETGGRDRRTRKRQSAEADSTVILRRQRRPESHEAHRYAHENPNDSEAPAYSS